MDKVKLTWYMHEILLHSFGAKCSFSELDTLIHNEDTRQTRPVWFALTSFLGHCAMISKYVDPIGKATPIKIQRKTDLRKALKISANSPILSRQARDNVEHFDERIDNWVDSNAPILELVVEDRRGFEFIAKKRHRIKRMIILDEAVFVSEGRNKDRFEVSLKPLAHESIRLLKEAENWMNTESPYKHIYPA